MKGAANTLWLLFSSGIVISATREMKEENVKWQMG